MPITQFHELDRLGRELTHLNRLYTLFEQFDYFNKDLRERHWQQVNLTEISDQVSDLLAKALSLPASLQIWEAFIVMKSTLQRYSEVCLQWLFVSLN